jgi:hypothetical protein
MDDRKMVNSGEALFHALNCGDRREDDGKEDRLKPGLQRT